MRVETLLRKEKEGTLFKDTKLASVMRQGLLDELLKIAKPSVAGEFFNEGSDSYLSGTPLPAGQRKQRGQYPSTSAAPLHDPPAPPEDTEPPQVFNGMSKIQCVLSHTTFDEFCKVAQGVTGEEALKALKKLHSLEESKPTPGEMARNALAGTIVGPTMGTAAGLIAGKQPFQEALERWREMGHKTPIRQSLGDPSFRKEVLRRGGLRTGRQMLASAASGAILGSMMPIVRTGLHQSAEKEKLRQYLGTSKRGKLRGKITRELGV